MIPYVCSAIFAVHDSWRYKKLDQRWKIAFKCLQICNQVARDCFWTNQPIELKTEDGVKCIKSFLTDSSLYQVLLSIIGYGGMKLVCCLSNKVF